MLYPKAYTPEQVAQMLQVTKNTVYQLISRGEIIAKKIGKVYRIPSKSLSFIFTGLDDDLYSAEQQDLQSLSLINKQLSGTRKEL